MDVLSNTKTEKNFINLAHHFGDFGIEVQWHFFATSHGKGPYDGIGRTIKREAALKQPYSGMILTLKICIFGQTIICPTYRCFFLTNLRFMNTLFNCMIDLKILKLYWELVNFMLLFLY